MVATPLTLEAADDLAFELVKKLNLQGVEDCEQGENAFTYFFESGHWAKVFVDDHGLNYLLKQPEED